MTPRRLALVLVAALLAATGAGGVSAARASSSSICVALVVDAHTLGAGVSTSCATVSKGANGVDVLQAAGHRIQFRSDGLICSLDGLPRGGCGAVDPSHYWAYFHRAPGATNWTYSTEGPSTYQPANGATEGWVWDDGESLTPSNVPHSTICPTKARPTPTATHPAGPKRTASPHRSRPAATAAATVTATSSSRPTPAAAHHRQAERATRPGATPRSKSRRSDSVSTPPTSPSPTPAALVGGADPPAQHHGLLDLLIGLVVVAGLGGLAARRFRRSRR